MLQYAPVHARVQHEGARRLDSMVEKAVRRGMTIARNTTPYGMFVEETAGRLGLTPLTVERAAAVARELQGSLLRPGPEGEAVRWLRTEEARVQGKGGNAVSAFAWAEDFRAGCGL